jgi:uncharacterized protein YbbC (DUF1343 family)
LKKALITLLLICLAVSITEARVVVGAERMEHYLPLLDGRRVGVVTNHTGVVQGRHLVDTLLARGVDIEVVFAPEHGFRGNLGAGDHVASENDPTTGLDIVSLYGNRRKPSPADIARCDVVVFDIQDVGLRYYTYLSTLHYVMEACAQGGVPLVLLDRPNPNGMYVDGPLLDTARHRSFVGMHPIPVVHGMTFGELAGMINGKGWLAGGVECDLRVVPCENYTHSTRSELPVRPSPNLPNQRSIYLYPSLCYFEATTVSVGRGTDFPFQVYGHPAMKGDFTFTPQPNGGAPNPPQKGVVCHGCDLRQMPDNEAVIAHGIDLSYLIDAYRQIGDEKFLSSFFEKLIGVDWVRGMIVEGRSADQIEARWRRDVERFLQERKPYLIYEED